MARAKPSSKRGNAVLHAQTIAPSLHSGAPTLASDWQALEGVVTQLRRGCTKGPPRLHWKAASAQWRCSLTRLIPDRKRWPVALVIGP